MNRINFRLKYVHPKTGSLPTPFEFNAATTESSMEEVMKVDGYILAVR